MMAKKNTMRTQMPVSVIKALDEWNTIAECKCHFLDNTNSLLKEFWELQLYTSSKYIESTRDGSASPTVKAYALLVQVLLDHLDSASNKEVYT